MECRRGVLGSGGGGLVALVLLSIAMAVGSTISTSSLSQTTFFDRPDSSRARIDVSREGDLVHVRALFTNGNMQRGRLTYDLEVRRTGSDGTAQTSQSGTFETAPGRTDTLSTVTVRARSGVPLSLYLLVRDREQLVDDVRIKRKLSPPSFENSKDPKNDNETTKPLNKKTRR